MANGIHCAYDLTHFVSDTAIIPRGLRSDLSRTSLSCVVKLAN